ncbi:hypothetical protein U0035_18610 [Niabella yanshanensis]|uniref:Outer membrane protein beta-barrel domain-containing protein n=1 Tax=Niabella yanshanensis TaxID=577386 RepID=A0ABZ0W370_9BACT|nr:hypothetical protein [Niabella yanshanensis]WQD37687.1 hypothetical protein U0035_18610 [Niabella yanshanensis]
MRKLLKPLTTLTLTLSLFNAGWSQNPSARPVLAVWDGMVIAGYVDKGAFVNFGGPCIKFASKPYVITLGMLPSFRIKEDKVAAGAKKNSPVTPNLGAGVSFAYKHLALQVPVYYNAKTTAADGRWHVGIGAGYRF